MRTFKIATLTTAACLTAWFVLRLALTAGAVAAHLVR